MILTLADEMSVNNLAEMADRIMDVATPIITTISASTVDNGIQRLIGEEVNTALQTQQKSCP